MAVTAAGSSSGVSVMVATVLMYTDIYGDLTYRSLGLVTVVTAVTTFRMGSRPQEGHTHVLIGVSVLWAGSSARDTLVADYDESSEPNLREGSPDAPGNRSATLSILPHCPHIGPVSSQLLAQATYE